MKYLGLDYGSRQIGIAISDDGGAIAFPRVVIPNDDGALVYITRLVDEAKISRIIMGDTRADNGKGNSVTASAERFAKALGRDSRVPVEYAREAWSSFEAARYAPGDHHNDAVAAAIILQRFIDMKNTDGATLPEELE